MSVSRMFSVGHVSSGKSRTWPATKNQIMSESTIKTLHQLCIIRVDGKMHREADQKHKGNR